MNVVNEPSKPDDQAGGLPWGVLGAEDTGLDFPDPIPAQASIFMAVDFLSSVPLNLGSIPISGMLVLTTSPDLLPSLDSTIELPHRDSKR